MPLNEQASLVAPPRANAKERGQAVAADDVSATWSYKEGERLLVARSYERNKGITTSNKKLLVAMPGATSSVLATSSDAPCYYSKIFYVFRFLTEQSQPPDVTGSPFWGPAKNHQTNPDSK